MGHRQSRSPRATLGGPSKNSSEGFAISFVVPIGASQTGVSTLLTALRALARTQPGRKELVLVDDASDEGLESLVRCWRTQFDGVAVARHEKAKGRGASVRTGVLAARGDFLIVVEPDTSVPISDAASLLTSLRGGADVALISRRMPGQESGAKQSFLERAAETTVLKLSQLLVPTGVYDSLSGLQGYRIRNAKEIAKRATVSGPAYVIEWLGLAQAFGCQIVEQPATPSKVASAPIDGNSQSALGMLRDAWRTRMRLSSDDHLLVRPTNELLSSTSFHRIDRDAIDAARRV